MKILLVIMFTLLSAQSWADSWTDSKTGLTWTYGAYSSYEYPAEGIAIYDVSPKPQGVLTIPPYINGQPVRSVDQPWVVDPSFGFDWNGDEFLNHCPDLTKVIFPDTIVVIGADMARWCPKLTSVHLPEGLRDIGKYSFMDCAITSVEYPSTLESDISHLDDNLTAISIRGGNNDFFRIYDGVLYYYGGESGDVRVEKGAEQLWTVCKDKKNLVVREDCKVMHGGAASRCPELKIAVLPEGFLYFKNNAFMHCPKLQAVYFKGAKVDNYASVDDLYGDSPSVTTYVLRNKGWEAAVAAGSWQGRPIKYFDGDIPQMGEDEKLVVSDSWSVKHTFNGLAYNGESLAGLVQVSTAKISNKGEVKISGFVMLQDGKKQSIKATGTVAAGLVKASAEDKKLGHVELTVGGNGFSGSIGGMKVESASVGENTGILKATVKLSYFDAKTGKIKTKSLNLGGVTSDGEAVGTLSVKKEPTKTFEALIK